MAPTSKRIHPMFRATDKPPHIYLDSLCLVKEVKKHPIIYDSNLPERNLFTTFAAWENVNAALIPLYHFLNENDKIIIRRNIRNRWTWMRSLVRRDVFRQRLDRHIQLKWMQEIQFLVPLLIERRNRMKRTSSTQLCGPSSSSMQQGVQPMSTSSSSPRNSEIVHELHDVMVQTFVTLFTPNSLHSQTDSDKNFLFALLQLFRKLSPQQKNKLKAKIDALFPK